MGLPAYKRVAFLGNDFALVPWSPTEPDKLARVTPAVFFNDCERCGALAGQLCVLRGDRQRSGHYRGNGRGKSLPEADRLAMCAGLIAAGRFDEIIVLHTQTIFKR